MTIELKPVFDKNYVTIVTSCSNEYAPYLLACFTSLKEHSSTEHNYDIIVCENGMLNSNQDIIKRHLNDKNFSVRFLNIDSKNFPIDVNKFCKGAHFSQETFFRILLPGLIPNYSKIVYIDTDIIILDDIYKLAQIDLEGNTVGACKDAMLNGWLKYENKMYKHVTETLELKDIKNYFQAGVMIFDCDKYRQNNCEQKLLELMKKTEMLCADQCILNKLFNTSVKILDLRWNYENECSIHKMQKWVDLMDADMKEEYLKSRENPAIIHYVGSEKPWFNQFGVDFADIWWEYARKTPLYETIMERYIRVQSQLQKNDAKAKKRNERKFRKYNILKNLSWGEKRLHYIKKYEYFRGLLEGGAV